MDGVAGRIEKVVGPVCGCTATAGELEMYGVLLLAGQNGVCARLGMVCGFGWGFGAIIIGVLPAVRLFTDGDR